MTSQDEDPEHPGREWVRVEKRGGRRDEEAVPATIHVPTPGEKVDRALAKARRELVRVERKYLTTLARSRELSEFAKHEVKIRLQALEGEDEG